LEGGLSMKGKVAIIGTGMAKAGKSPVSSALLFAEAALEAMNEANVTISAIQALHVGNAYSATTEKQTNIAPLILSILGVKNNIPCARYEAACCSGSIAFRQGYLNILSGEYDYMLVGGTERLRAAPGDEIQEAMATGMDVEERKAGLTFGSYWAYVIKAYAKKYGIKMDRMEKLLAEISVKNHFNASFNKKAHFQNIITVDDVMQSLVVAPPVKVQDCCPFSDGAAALVLASEKVAKNYKNPVWIEGSGQASGRPQIAEVEDLAVSHPGMRKAIADAYKQAGVGPKDIDIVEVHDCVNIHEVLCLEGADFFKPGEAIYAAEEKKTYWESELPVNLSGGLKARGHAVGATGAYQLCEIARQLRGDFQGRQAKNNPEVGLTVNVGGTAAVFTSHVLRKG
jgi:acetyl-CoA acetyltransferase